MSSGGMSQSTRAKRRRQESEPGNGSSTSLGTEPTWTRHHDLWLDHGDIIAVCGSVGFRVSKCVLALNSSVFREMFESLDPGESDVYEGQCVVCFPDKAEDMYHFFKAMHYKRYGRIQSEPPFSVFASILKLSTKYMVDDLRSDIIDALITIFPPHLESWNEKHLEKYILDADEMLAVELALQFDVPIILPAACYVAAFHSVREINNQDTSAASASTRWTCALFRDDLVKAVTKILNRSHSNPANPFRLKLEKSKYPSTCLYSDDCDGVLSKSEPERAMENKLRSLAWPGVFSPCLCEPQHKDLCSLCQRKIQRHWTPIRQEVWHTLPTLCGFTSWAAVFKAQGLPYTREDRYNSDDESEYDIEHYSDYDVDFPTLPF